METLTENSVNSVEDSKELILSQAGVYLIQHNKSKSEQTACPSMYPQGKFKDKPCRNCLKLFSPKAPSELYCSDICADIGIQDKYLLRKYGITTKDYNEMYINQNGLCAICNKEGFRMAEHHKLKLVVDHCHSTGSVRGLLCHNCNRALGLLKDSIESLEKAVKYLKVQRLSRHGVGLSGPKRRATKLKG